MSQTDAEFVEVIARRIARDFVVGVAHVDVLVPERDRLVALARRALGNEDAEGREASLCDLLNTQAREVGVEEAERQEETKALADRLWAYWSSKLADAEARVRELEEALACDPANWRVTTTPDGQIDCYGTRLKQSYVCSVCRAKLNDYEIRQDWSFKKDGAVLCPGCLAKRAALARRTP